MAERRWVKARITDDGRVEPIVRPLHPDGPDGTVAADTADTGDPELIEAIRAEIGAAGGRITFARFMELALYHPERGYYATSAERPTRSGDFLTAPEVHPVFGRLIGRQLTEMWERLGRPERFDLVEHGAGRGTLGISILRGLDLDGSGLARVVRYRAVDIPGRAAVAHERVRAAGYEPIPDSEDAGPSPGCVLANELLDAMPVHRVGMLDGELVEWFVTAAGDGFGEVPGEPSTPALAARLEREGVVLREGQRAEICLAIEEWLRTARLDRGYLLVIDYGYPAAELYGPRRLGGTLRAFRGHHVTADPFRAIGRQDLTAHVDLTALELAAADAGLDHLGRTTQAEFVIGLGLGDLLAAAQADPSTTWDELLALRTAVARFIDPGALGGFAVELFSRCVERGEPLRGLSFRVPRA